MTGAFFSGVTSRLRDRNAGSDGNAVPPLAAVLDRKRRALALGLQDNIAGWEKYAHQIAAGRDGDEFLERELYVFIDYLALYFRTGEEAYKHLYIGEKLKQLYYGREIPQQHRARAEGQLEADERVLLDGLAGEVSPESLDSLRRELQDIRRVVLGEAATTLTILLVGDCLFLDIQAFLTARCLEDGIATKPHVRYREERSGLAERPAQAVRLPVRPDLLQPFQLRVFAGLRRLDESTTKPRRPPPDPSPGR